VCTSSRASVAVACGVTVGSRCGCDVNSEQWTSKDVGVLRTVLYNGGLLDGGALSDESPHSHTAQLQDMCRGNARCELCPVTARLRPASVALAGTCSNWRSLLGSRVHPSDHSFQATIKTMEVKDRAARFCARAYSSAMVSASSCESVYFPGRSTTGSSLAACFRNNCST
jgi:hypothetical protein